MPASISILRPYLESSELRLLASIAQQCVASRDEFQNLKVRLDRSRCSGIDEVTCRTWKNSSIDLYPHVGGPWFFNNQGKQTNFPGGVGFDEQKWGHAALKDGGALGPNCLAAEVCLGKWYLETLLQSPHPLILVQKTISKMNACFFPIYKHLHTVGFAIFLKNIFKIFL